MSADPPTSEDLRTWRKLIRECRSHIADIELKGGDLKKAADRAFKAIIPARGEAERKMFWRLITFARTYAACSQRERASNAEAFRQLVDFCADAMGPDQDPPPTTPAAALAVPTPPTKDLFPWMRRADVAG